MNIKLILIIFANTAGLILCSSITAAPSPQTTKEQAFLKAFEEFKQRPGEGYFTAPKGWAFLEADQLPPQIKIMAKGQSTASDLPPSLNLAVEPVNVNIKQYLASVKALQMSTGGSIGLTRWSELGLIKTQAGEAVLAQVDTLTNWGEVRIMQAIIIRNNKAYVLTASALKEEFSRFYEDFFQAMQSLTINKTVFEMVSNQNRRSKLSSAYEQLILQNTSWKSFEALLDSDFSDMGTQWRAYVLDQAKEETKNLAQEEEGIPLENVK